MQYTVATEGQNLNINRSPDTFNPKIKTAQSIDKGHILIWILVKSILEWFGIFCNSWIESQEQLALPESSQVKPVQWESDRFYLS